MIKRQVKGTGPEGTFLSADFGNQVIDIVNALSNMEIVPTGFGKIEVTKGKAILKLPAKKLSYGSLNGTLVAHWLLAVPEPNAPGL